MTVKDNIVTIKEEQDELKALGIDLSNLSPQKLAQVMKLVNHVVENADEAIDNPYFGQDEYEDTLRSIPHNVVVYTIGDLMKDLGNEHLIPSIVQREPCWKEEYQKKVIESICAGIPIGAMHFVKIRGEDKVKGILDGYQRTEAIKAFGKGKIKVKLELLPEGKYIIPKGYSRFNKYEEFTWGQIKNFANQSGKNHNLDIFAKLEEQISSFNFMHVVVWDCMTEDLQAKLFGTINTSVPPNNDEHVYCTDFRMKILIHYILNKYVSPKNEGTEEYEGVISHGEKALKANKRFVLYRFIHNILYYAFGESFTDTIADRALSLKEIKKSAHIFNNKLRELGVTDHKDMNIEVLKELEIIKACELLRDTSKAIDYVFKAKGSKNTKLDKNILRDIIVFTLAHIRSGRLSPSLVKKEWVLYHDLIIKYKEELNKNNGALKAQSTELRTLNQRRQLFNELLVNSDIVNLNDSKKLTKSEAWIIKQKAIGKKDPITGEILRDGDIHVDHVQCKSKNSTQNYAALSSESNSVIKRDLTSSHLDKIKKYIDKEGV